MSATMGFPDSPIVKYKEISFNRQVYQQPFHTSIQASSTTSLASISSSQSFGFTVDNMALKTVVLQYHHGHLEALAKFCLDNDNPGDLYYSKLPVPGIYSIMPNKKRYLVALKPNRKYDDEFIFSSQLDLESDLVSNSDLISNKSQNETNSNQSSATSSNSSSSSSMVNFDTSNNASNAATPSTSNSSSSTDITTFSNTSSTSSRSTVSSILSTRSIRFADHKKPTQEDTPTKNQKLDYHHQKTTSKTSLSSTLSHNKAASLQKCDINGYKPIRKPLRIKFCKVLDRWMFASEIEERLLNTIVCPCDHRDPKGCKKGVWKDFIALDDGVSWVVVKKGEEKIVDGVRVLYCVDEETDCMRKQNKIEEGKSRRVLEEAKGGKGRSMFFNETADYMVVLRYLGMGCQENERRRKRHK